MASDAADGFLGDWLPHKAKCSCLDCQLQRSQARIRELEQRLKELDWSPISETNLPRLGDEVGSEWGDLWRVDNVTRLKMRRYSSAQDWFDQSFTHRRPLNPPRPEAKP